MPSLWLSVSQAREKGVPDTPMGRQQQQRVGLGKVGPLRFRNSRQHSKPKTEDKQKAGEAAATGEGVEAATAGKGTN